MLSPITAYLKPCAVLLIFLDFLILVSFKIEENINNVQLERLLNGHLDE